MRFAHLADTHIRNLKYHEEYRVVFDRLYKELAKQKPDYIIHCGDIAHTKTQISPEFVQMCSDFFRNLADIAPTYIILGNHDGNLRNSSRQDALTPIISALEHSNLHLLRNSREVALKGNFSLNALSVFDEENWQPPSDTSRINIALYHGSISNCQTDAGWTMERGENDLSIFDNFDYGFLGDIHKTNQALDKLGKIRYPGSTVQQNHGETNDKGYLLWDIETKDTFKVTHHTLKNPKPFVTVVLTHAGRIPKKTEVPKGARLRLVSESNLPLNVVRKAVEASKVRFKPEAITYVNRSAGIRGNVEEMTNGLVQEDLRDTAIQEELIDEYLKDFQASASSLEKVYELNRKYKAIVEEQEEVDRNINWKIRHLEWDNLFNYGENNNINFSNMSGVIGILGKNFSGKSSIIDSLLYTIYNTTSKHNRKNLNIINQNKKDCRGYVEIDVGSKTYMIERVSKKYQKKLKGKATTEAKTDVDFKILDNATGEERELNGLSRIDTDQNIRKIFGTIDDFLLTSMASQLGSLSYINEGSTKRKEILAKFLDLEIFENKFRKAKEDAADMRGILKRSEEREFESELKLARTQFARNDTSILTRERECQNAQDNTQKMLDEYSDIDAKIRSLPTEIIDIYEVENKLKKQKEMLSFYEKENKISSKDLQESKTMFDKLAKFLEAFDVSSLEEKQKLIEKNYDKLDKIEKEINKHEDQLERQKKKINLLNEVPCGPEFSHCKFIKDAYYAKEKINGTLVTVEKLSASKKAKQSSINNLEPNKINEYITKYEQVIEKKSLIHNEINSFELTIEKNNTKMLKSNNIINDLKNKKKEYEENREAIENLESLFERKKELEKLIFDQKQELQLCQKKILDLYKVNGSLEQQLNNIDQEYTECKEIQEQYSAYDLFMRCMHSNGIAFDIIKKRLPLINSEISKILTNIVDFEIMFVNEDTKLDILIKHPGYDARPIEMASGAEKTIAAMAIRLALLNISTLPKGDVFILDEPGTALDEENMEGFIRILDMIKTQFKTVLLISHLDSLKDIVDTQIIIEKKEGFAIVNH